MTPYEALIQRVRYLNVSTNPADYVMPVKVKVIELPKKRTRIITTFAKQKSKARRSKSGVNYYRAKNPIEKYTKASDDIPTGFKFCHKKKHVVELGKFGDNKKSKDGKFIWCRDCQSEYKREQRRKAGLKTIVFPKVEDGYKWCNKGKHPMLLDKFSKDKKSKDGKACVCTPCAVEANRRRRKLSQQTQSLNEAIKKKMK